ncbi:MAG TPA: type II secretion system F family protein [Jiangellaceae bacterium]
MTLILVGGALAGLGVLLLALVLAPPRTNPAVALAQLDIARGRARTERLVAARRPTGGLADSRRLRLLGEWLRTVLARWDIELGGVRSDLSLLGRPLETHLAITALVALGGFLTPVIVQALLAVVTGGAVGGVSLALGLAFGALAGLVPTLTVRSRAADRRRDFRHVVSSFLDLVAMNLAGGRGVPEALQTACEVSDDWAMVRIRDTLSSARLHGITPWAALGELGDEIKIDELRDLAAALALVAEDGAKVRESLSARAISMRRRELAEAESKAGERSQSMLIAQLLLAIGFLIFLVYPAMANMLISK